MGYNDKPPNWVHEGEYSLRWPVVLWGSRQLSKELLPRRVLEGPSFHHRTPVKQTVLKSLGVKKSKTQGRLQLEKKKTPQEIHLKLSSLRISYQSPDMLSTPCMSLSPLMIEARFRSKQGSHKCCRLLNLLKAGGFLFVQKVICYW